MKRLGIFLLPPGWDDSPSQGPPPNITIISTHLYTWVERGIVRVKCLAQKTQQNVPGQSSNPDHSIWKKLTNHEASPCINKHLMTGPKGNSEFCFPKTLNVEPQGKADGNIEVEGKQKSLFPAEPVIECFVIPPHSKIKKNCEEIVCLRPAGSQICRSFKEHDLITCESKGQVVVSLGS